MRSLCKINLSVFALVLILASGCASTHHTKTAGTDAHSVIGPESCIVPPDANKTQWWEYALMPVTTAGWIFQAGQNNPGVPSLKW